METLTATAPEALDPDFAPAYYDRAQAHDGLGNAQQAFDDYTTFLNLHAVDDNRTRNAQERIVILDDVAQ